MEMFPALKQALDAPKVGTKSYNSGRYNASNFGWCLRKTFNRRVAKTGLEHRYLENDLILEVGERIHEVVQARVLKAFPGSLVEIPIQEIWVTPEEVEKYLGEATFTKPVQITGRSDLILILPDGQMGVFEVKSGKPELLRESAPKWSHRLQNGVYWRGIPGDVYGYIYLDRTGFQYRIHEEPDPEGMWKEVLRIINEVEKHVKSGTTPELEAEKCRRLCKSCEYFNDCFGR